MAFQRGTSNYATSPETQIEDTFISEMLGEFGKFNQDFFIMKILSKSIDSLGADPQKFILLVDMLEDSLLETKKLGDDYSTKIKDTLDSFEKNEGKEPGDMEKKLSWQLKRAGKKYAVIFGKLASMQPVEIIGEVNPMKYQEYVKKKEIEMEREETGKLKGEFEIKA